MDVVPLTPQGFAPFGDVIQVGEGGDSANQGSPESPLEDSDLKEPPAIGNLCSFSVSKSKTPFELNCQGTYWVIVALNDPVSNTPDMSTLTFFKCQLQNRMQGFNYKPGIWHHPMVVFEHDIDFIMYVYERGSQSKDPNEDTEEYYLPSPILME